ncbi:MAG: DNA primase [Rubrivivax sp.]|nr:MAG: DNA primase [Rubrivivax sp.]
MIPSSFIQDLLARTDVVDIVGRHVTLKKAGINYKGLCPFHGEKSPSFIVSPSRQTYHCFGCGVHGNAVGFLMEHAGLNFVEAVKELAQINGMLVPEEQGSQEDRDKARQQKEKQATLTDVLDKAAQHWKQQLKASARAVSYLKGRGLTGEIAARFALGYAPDNWRGLASVYPRYDDPLLVESGLVIVPEDSANHGEDARRYDRFRDRIMFPIRSVQGQVIGFGGRVLDKGEPKYLNSPETPVFSKGRELYGLYEARTALRNKGYVLVTEGYMDVVALAQWGFANAVATLGTACTDEHVHKLFRFTEQVVFSFDGDAAGRRAAGRALEAALPHATDTRRISFLFLPKEHDPDSYIREHGPEAFEACVKQAVPLSRQLIQHAGHECELDSAEGRVKLLAQALPLLAQMPDGVLRGQIADDLAAQARVASEEVRQRLAAHLQGAGHGQPRGRGGEGRLSGQQGPSGAPGHHADQDTGPPSDEYEGAGAGQDWTSYGSGGDQGQAHGQGRSSGQGSQGGYSRRDGQNGQGGQRGPWKGKSGKGWQRDGGGWSRQSRQEMRPLPQAARPLERAAWLLLHRSDLWDHLPADAHELLCDQPLPLGAYFRWLDRLVHDQGPLGPAELLQALRGQPSGGEGDVAPNHDEALATLADRLDKFHTIDTVAAATAEELMVLVRPLQLLALKDELDLLLQSGELSEVAESRKIELIRQTNTLKLEISRARPTLG